MSENDVPVESLSVEEEEQSAGVEADGLDSTGDAESGPVAAGESAVEGAGEDNVVDEAAIAKLDEALKKFTGQKRWSDVIKTTIAKAELVGSAGEKVELLGQAGEMYLERSSNQAEAIKCFSRVLELEPSNAGAIERLKEMFEKRRDWERLVGVLRVEADGLDESEQLVRRQEIADLATERLRKPAVCIELWRDVLTLDGGNSEALAALGNLYERAREWAALVEVLEASVDQGPPEEEMVRVLTKLGGVYADKLKDDDGAVSAYVRLLQLRPDDRRAQDQIKKRYVALQAWDELEAFYATTEKWDELIRTLERAADSDATTDLDKIQILFRVARLWVDEKDKPDRAARAYEKILTLDGSHRDAADALAPIYERAGDSRKLVAVNETRLGYIEDLDERVALLLSSAKLHDEKLRSPQLALECMLTAFAEQPANVEVREALEELAARVDKSGERVLAAYSVVVEAAEGEELKADLRLAYGRMLEAAGQTDLAVVEYQAVLEGRPNDLDAIEALAGLFEKTGDSSSLAGIIESRLALEEVADVRKVLSYQLAALRRDELDDPAGAVDIYRGIVLDFGDNEAEAYDALAGLLVSLERWDELAESLEQRIDSGPSDEVVLCDLMFQLAQTFLTHLGDRLRATGLFQEILMLAPGHAGALAALDDLLVDQELGGEVARILEPVYEQRDDAARLVDVLEVAAKFAVDATSRTGLLARVAELQMTQLGNVAAAFDTVCRAVREAPEDGDLAGKLLELAGQQERYGDVAALFEELAEGTSDPLLARRLWMARARILDQELGDVDRAVSAYGQALSLDGGDVEVLEQLEDLYRRTERWLPLIDVLRSRVGHTSEPEQQEQLLAQVAFIQAEMVGDPAAAISVYGEVIEINPRSVNALSQLDVLYEEQEMWPELADNVGRQLELAEDDDARVSLMLRLAALRETRMQAVEGAIELYKELLEQDPLLEDALSAMERMLQIPEHQQTIADAMESIYRDTGSFEKLIAVYEIQLSGSTSTDLSVHLLHQIANLYETALQEEGQAFDCYARSLEKDAANPDTLMELERLAATIPGWEKLVTVYEGQARKTEDPMLGASLFSKAAGVLEAQLGDSGRATGLFCKVLELDGQNIEAANALERLYHGSEQHAELAGIYLAKAGMLDVPEQRREYLFRAAALYEDLLRRPSDAVAVYKRCLDEDPDDIEAIDRLIALYNGQEDWPALLAAYDQKADLVEDFEEKKALLVGVGDVYEQRLGQSDKAIEVFQRVLELDPTTGVALQRLDALYLASERWDALLGILEREVELEADPDLSVGARCRIGELHELKLDDPLRAVDVYRDILDMYPEHVGARAALERMIAAGAEAVAAALVLEPIYRVSGESQSLVSVLEVLAKSQDDGVRQIELLHQVGEIYEIHLGDSPAAFDAYARALEADAEQEETLLALQRLAEQLGCFDKLAVLYDAQIERERGDGADGTVLSLAWRAAQVYEVHLGDVESAIARYRTVVDLDSTQRDGLAALDRLYEASGQAAALAGVVAKQAEVAETVAEELGFRFRLAQIQQHSLAQPALAIAGYQEVLAAEPEHQGALAELEGLLSTRVEIAATAEVLEPIYRAQGAWDKLVQLGDVQLESLVDKAERSSLIQRVAEIAEEHLQAPGTALDWILRAVLEEPENGHLSREAMRLAEDTGEWSGLSQVYATAAEKASDPVVSAELAGQLAVVFEQRLNDVQRAEESYRFVLGRAPQNEDALEALDRIYTQHGAGEGLVNVLRSRLELASDDFDRVELGHRLGLVLYNEVERPEEAVEVLTQVLDSWDPEHEPSIKALQGVFAANKDWAALYGAYERELRVAVGDEAQSEVLGRMAHLASTELGQPDKAVELLRQVLDLLGEEAAALNALGNLYAIQESWSDLVDALEREVAVTDDDAMRTALYLDLGRVWYEKLGRERSALESWERVLDIEPGATGALFSIAAVHRAGEAHSDLVDTLHRIVDTGAASLENDTLEGVFMELGALYCDVLDRPQDASEQYRKALELNAQNFAAMAALEQIYLADELWVEVVDIKSRRCAALDDPQLRVQELLAVAEVWKSKLEQPDGARTAFEQILELDFSHEEAFEQLEALHHQAERFDELIELYIVRAEGLTDVQGRVDLLRKVAGVYERDQGDRNQAFDALLLAWQQDFSSDETADELERIAGLTQRWSEVLTTANGALQELQQAVPGDRTALNAICVKCARWYGREGHPEYAIPYLQQVLASDPVNRPAMQQMAELHKQTQQWQEYGQVLTRLAEMTEEPAEKAHTFIEMGQLQEEHFAAPDKAVVHFQAALRCIAGSLPALDALARIYTETQEWQELAGILGRRVEALEDAELVQQAKLELAETVEDRLGDVARATAEYKEILEADSSCLPALKGLERLYAQQELWLDLLGVLETQLELVSNERDRVVLLTRMAGMWEEEFLKPDKASAALEQVLDVDPTHVEALQGLARLYRTQQNWHALIETLERHVQATPERDLKVELFGQIGAVYQQELDDLDRAVEAYLNVTDIEPNSQNGLTALAALYESKKDFSLAIDTMERLVVLVDSVEMQVELLFRMGRVFGSEMDDQVSAVDYFQRATDLDGGHLPSLEAMRDIYVQEGDFSAAARVLSKAADAEPLARKQSVLRVELGRLYENQLRESDAAVEAFEQALGLDPDNVDAALPLVDEYMKTERFADSEPLLQMLVRSAGRLDSAEQHRLWFAYGECTEKLGDDETACRAYASAFELDSQDLASLNGLASAYYRRKDWEQAFKFYQMILVHHRDELGGEEITHAFFRLGVIKRALGDTRKALNMFEKALEEDGAHADTLAAMVSLNEERGAWDQVVHFKKRILDITDDADGRFDLYSEVGDLWQDKLGNAAAAIEAFVEASVIKPDDHKMLHKLMALYLKTAQWEAVVDTIDRITELDTRPAVQAKNAYTVGVILRDELKDPAAALERFNLALDVDALGQLKAFEAINKIHTLQKSWKELERAYRKMLRRVTGKGNEELEFNLWHSLGVIYRDRLGDLAAGAEAFSMASRLQPDNLQEHQILAEIYARVPGRTADAIAQYQTLLERSPSDPKAYRALYKLYFADAAYDKAWCISATLNFLQRADAEQKQFYEQYRPDGPIRPKARLTDELWAKEIFHQDEDFLVGKIFESITSAILQWRKVSDKRLDLKKKDEVADLANTTISMATMFGVVQQVFGLPISPRLFVCPERPMGLEYAATIPPASVCGSALIRDVGLLDVLFVVARHLAYYRGEHYIRTMLQTKDELKVALAAAMRIAGAEIANPAVEKTAAEIKARMQPAQLEVLSKVGRRFIDAGARADLKVWMRSVELSASRAGFLMCNDLGTAARMLQSLPPVGTVELTTKERLEDLIQFSVSENYFRLREALGIAIGNT